MAGLAWEPSSQVRAGNEERKERRSRSPIVGVAMSNEHIGERGPRGIQIAHQNGAEHIQLEFFLYKGLLELNR